jgi:hypothetical protein
MARSPEDQAEARRLCSVRARLKGATRRLEDFLHRLQTLHADRSGSFRLMYCPPLLGDEWRPLERLVSLRRHDAQNGCPLAADWLEETSALRERIAALRNTPLPAKDPTYDGPAVLPHFALRAGKRQRSRPADDPERKGQMVAEYMARMEARKARSRALLEEFLRDEEAISGGS